ncbi:MAG TPA: hypothetical protein DCY94_01470 [Firmicutes bacterium]|nr:hypothetical protein [Bacillota bacterium]
MDSPKVLTVYFLLLSIVDFKYLISMLIFLIFYFLDRRIHKALAKTEFSIVVEILVFYATYFLISQLIL